MKTLSKREQIMLLVLAVFLVVVGGYYLLILPGMARLNAAHTQLEQLQSEKTSHVLAIEDAQVYAAIYEDNMKEIEDARNKFYSPMRSEALSGLITEFALRYGLTPSAVNVAMEPVNNGLPQNQEEEASPFQYYQVGATVYGKYEDFMRLLDEFNNTPSIAVTGYAYEKNLSDIYFMWRYGLVPAEEIDESFFLEQGWMYANISFTLDVYVYDDQNFDPSQPVIGPVVEG